MESPVLLTFDIFGTVLNWFDGLKESLHHHGIVMDDGLFNRVIDYQGQAEQAFPTLSYSAITTQSLRAVCGVNAPTIGENVGNWPLFNDSSRGLKSLMEKCPCMAMSNSDYIHRDQVQKQLGFNLNHWLCAEDLGLYKPNPEFWDATSKRLQIPYTKKWWHVSAYADYDLEVAKNLGLSCVFVKRKHSRPGPSDLVVQDLEELGQIVAQF